MYPVKVKRMKVFLLKCRKKLSDNTVRIIFKILDTISIDGSSTQGNRKKFHKMLELAEECRGKVAFVVNYVDRLQRAYTDTPGLERLRSSGKIEIHTLRENLVIIKDSAAMDLTV